MTTVTPAKQTVEVLGRKEPRMDPIARAKAAILTALNKSDWKDHPEWQAFKLNAEAFSESDNPRSGYLPSHIIQSVCDRVKGHYIRQGKRPRIIWQHGPDEEGYVVYVKLNP